MPLQGFICCFASSPIEEIPAWIWLIVGFCLITVFLVLKSKMSKEEPGKTFSQFTRTELQVREELDKLFIQIQEISRENIAKLDNKIRILNQLLKEVDEKKQVLESMIRQIHDLKEKTTIKSEPIQNPLHDKVIKMKEKGANIDSICKELGMERGEVELIIGLRNISNE